MAQTTTIIIPGRSPITNVPGSKTVQEVKNMYGNEVTGLRSMDGTRTVDGDVTTITFRHRSGTKGAQTTTIIIPGRSPITNVPGSKTVQEVKNMYGNEVTGLRSMDGTRTVDGDVTTITFRHRSGTKG